MPVLLKSASFIASDKVMQSRPIHCAGHASLNEAPLDNIHPGQANPVSNPWCSINEEMRHGARLKLSLKLTRCVVRSLLRAKLGQLKMSSSLSVPPSLAISGLASACLIGLNINIGDEARESVSAQFTVSKVLVEEPDASFSVFRCRSTVDDEPCWMLRRPKSFNRAAGSLIRYLFAGESSMTSRRLTDWIKPKAAG